MMGFLTFLTLQSSGFCMYSALPQYFPQCSVLIRDHCVVGFIGSRGHSSPALQSFPLQHGYKQNLLGFSCCLVHRRSTNLKSQLNLATKLRCWMLLVISSLKALWLFSTHLSLRVLWSAPHVGFKVKEISGYKEENIIRVFFFYTFSMW